MLRVSTNFVTTTAINDLRRLSEEQARLHQTIATGRRLLKPSDDPAATSRVLNRQMEAERVGNYQSAASMAQSRSDGGEFANLTVSFAVAAVIGGVGSTTR